MARSPRSRWASCRRGRSPSTTARSTGSRAAGARPVVKRRARRAARPRASSPSRRILRRGEPDQCAARRRQHGDVVLRPLDVRVEGPDRAAARPIVIGHSPPKDNGMPSAFALDATLPVSDGGRPLAVSRELLDGTQIGLINMTTRMTLAPDRIAVSQYRSGHGRDRRRDGNVVWAADNGSTRSRSTWGSRRASSRSRTRPVAPPSPGSS